MGTCTAKFLVGDGFMGDSLDHFWTRDKHVGGVANHEDKVRYRRGVHRSTGARAHDHGDLRNDARGQNVALENLCVTG